MNERIDELVYPAFEHVVALSVRAPKQLRDADLAWMTAPGGSACVHREGMCATFPNRRAENFHRGADAAFGIGEQLLRAVINLHRAYRTTVVAHSVELETRLAKRNRHDKCGCLAPVVIAVEERCFARDHRRGRLRKARVVFVRRENAADSTQVARSIRPGSHRDRVGKKWSCVAHDVAETAAPRGVQSARTARPSAQPRNSAVRSAIVAERGVVMRISATMCSVVRSTPPENAE